MPSLSPLTAALLDAFDDPALLLDGQIVTAANGAALELLGDSVEGRDIRLAIRHPQALQLILTPPRNVSVRADLDLTGIGSSERPWTLRVRELGGNSRLVVLADRTAQVAADRMRTDFVANASHELRTPLSTIIGYAETLAEDGQLDDSLRQQFGGTIHSESRRMLRIIEDLMSLSRIEADRYRAPSDHIDLSDIARAAVANCQLQANEKGCVLSLDLEADIPRLLGDHGQLLQVAENLISNAIRYGCRAKGERVEVTVRREGTRAVLSVRDHGDGVAAEHLPRLTERFYRVDDARSRDSGGTGLGLAIVKHIVERHRGQLDIRSAPGNGTDIKVSFNTI